MLEREREALIRQIERAFVNVERPKSLGDELELRDLEGKDWRDLTIDLIWWNKNFHFFWWSGMRYMLPGYLTVMLKHPEHFGSEVIEPLLQYFAREGTYGQQFVHHCKVFDHDQQRVILKFLDMVEPLWFPAINDMDAHLAKTPLSLKYIRAMEITDERTRHLDLIAAAKQIFEGCK